MSKQSDQANVFVMKGANRLQSIVTSLPYPFWPPRSVRKLCVMGGLNYVFSGSAFYTDYTDWK